MFYIIFAVKYFHILLTTIYMTYLFISQYCIYINIMFMYVDHNANKIELNWIEYIETEGVW